MEEWKVILGSQARNQLNQLRNVLGRSVNQEEERANVKKATGTCRTWDEPSI